MKLPKAITHEARLRDCEALVGRFADEAGGLGIKLGAVLVQLPPSLAFDAGIADRFFAMLRERVAVDLACEPRHGSWFTGDADALLVGHRVARVAADPAPAPTADRPGGWYGLTYFRLHGSPKIYYSPYDEAALAGIGRAVTARRAGGSTTWCIFDNTAAFAATGNALALAAGLEQG